ncbi:leucyl/phenylalanyl-tRNA--protein transferase [Altererythrobacter sp. BO-6]|uniref:leucyl/phenylalanyl-tRNA--protein transferase n=1 Tax=Altererythrobacter sp. BO-6 TaxID=2604537 RepID=UPI0013E116E0|nr:leucyl/phenylalanyl-tRNA--protein transferase [Altererythrobacter sp. BO-6]QIG53941.1 leucyl/phenylalanyl-tRNA--protein transferase [Altererythrobacter sp. BO-6]
MHSPFPPPIPSDMLLLAYRSGIFPMADGRDDPEVFWVEPKQRAIIPLEQLHVSRSLRKAIRQDRFQVTVDRDFAAVIEACSHPREDHPESWISERIIASYRQLHSMGHAHSIECWEGSELVGGLYGVSFDRVFCGESMFSRRSDASKVALAWLVALMRLAGFHLLDCQFMTDHLRSMGAVEITQQKYLEGLVRASGQAEFSLPGAYQRVLGKAKADHSTPGKLIAQSFTQTS